MPDKNKGRRYEHAPLYQTARFTRLGEVCTRALEAEVDRWFLFVPVFFRAGILLYFSLPLEPDGRLALGGVLASLGLFFAIHRTSMGFALGLVACTG